MLLNKIYHQDNLEGMAALSDHSIDCILTDPPYLYLKGQKLEREFDEKLFFSQCKRVLKKDGIIVLFGRGTSFYRWNTILADLKFKFKEEIIWDKGQSTSPLLPLARVHETVSIHSLGKGKINKVKVPYVEMKQGDIPSIVKDINGLKAIFKNPKSLEDALRYVETGKISLEGDHKSKFHVSTGPSMKDTNRVAGMISSMDNGMNEKTIIRQTRDHLTAIHPTQKPVRLLERLLNLTSQPGNIVLDPFCGSGSTAVACLNTRRRFIGYEIDQEYFYESQERIQLVTQQSGLRL